MQDTIVLVLTLNVKLNVDIDVGADLLCMNSILQFGEVFGNMLIEED